MKARLESLAAHLPERVVSIQERVGAMANPPSFDLEAVTGIHSVHVCGPGDDSLSMGLRAAREALSRSAYKAEDLDVVISASVSRSIRGVDLWEPALSFLFKQELGAQRAMNFDVANASAGMFSAVLLLDRMIQAGSVRNGLIISGECLTPMVATAQKEIYGVTDPQFLAMTLADSAAALVLDRSPNDADAIHYCEALTCAEQAELSVGMPSELNAGPALYSSNADMYRKDQLQGWSQALTEFFRKNKKTLGGERFDHVIHQQVAARFIQKANDVFDGALPAPLDMIEFLGNTGSTSPFVVLYEALKSGQVKKGEKILIVPNAAGHVTGFLSLSTANLGV